MTQKIPTLSLDLEKYEAMLASSDATEAEKRELIQTLWALITEFVLLGFNVAPIQQVMQLQKAENTPVSATMITHKDHTMLPSMQEKEEV